MKYVIKSLPARYGDCLWIEYGSGQKVHRILIDGGTKGTRANIETLIAALPEHDRHFELIVVTHVDRDHIEGILSLLEEPCLGFSVDDFWFNGWQHLPVESEEQLGPVQGERLSAAIWHHQIPWNKAFVSQAVVVPVSEVPPVVVLPGGMRITLLSPLIRNLIAMRCDWEKEVRKAGLAPGFGTQRRQKVELDEEILGALPDVEELNDREFREDESAANGSSIAFLASFGEKTVFFGADSLPSVALGSLKKVYGGKVPLDLVKLSHHASEHNTSPELIEKFDCHRYLISTNGSIYHHPSAVTVARLIKRGGVWPEIFFNYRSEYNEMWDSRTLKVKHSYKTTYPTKRTAGIEIALI